MWLSASKGIIMQTTSISIIIIIITIIYHLFVLLLVVVVVFCFVFSFFRFFFFCGVIATTDVPTRNCRLKTVRSFTTRSREENQEWAGKIRTRSAQRQEKTSCWSRSLSSIKIAACIQKKHVTKKKHEKRELQEPRQPQEPCKRAAKTREPRQNFKKKSRKSRHVGCYEKQSQTVRKHTTHAHWTQSLWTHGCSGLAGSPNVIPAWIKKFLGQS